MKKEILEPRMGDGKPVTARALFIGEIKAMRAAGVNPENPGLAGVEWIAENVYHMADDVSFPEAMKIVTKTMEATYATDEEVKNS